MDQVTADLEAVELLVFGPHPDDIEIGMAGTVAKHTSLGHRVGLCDLTAGEMSSNGTVEERLSEAEAAREVLGARWRVNLRCPDRAIGSSPEHVRAAVELIRRARPNAVAVPYWSDRHPDHARTSDLVSEAVFSAGLRRFSADGEPWRPDRTCYYFINDHTTPSFVIDVSAHYQTKRRALAAHASQFAPKATDAVATRLTSVRFQQLIESRDAHFGAQAGVAFAEGFVVRHTLIRRHLLLEQDAS